MSMREWEEVQEMLRIVTRHRHSLAGASRLARSVSEDSRDSD